MQFPVITLFPGRWPANYQADGPLMCLGGTGGAERGLPEAELDVHGARRGGEGEQHNLTEIALS